MDFALWLVAFEKYALAAVATDQLSFEHAVLHKEVVMEVAAVAQVEGRSAFLAVLYDELVRSCGCRVACVRISAVLGRKRWEDLAEKLGSAADVGREVGALHEPTLRSAKVKIQDCERDTAAPCRTPRGERGAESSGLPAASPSQSR